MGRKSQFDSNFKAKVAIEALQEKDTLQNLARKYNVLPSCMESWKESLLSNSQIVFERLSIVRRLRRQYLFVDNFIWTPVIKHSFFQAFCYAWHNLNKFSFCSRLLQKVLTSV